MAIDNSVYYQGGIRFGPEWQKLDIGVDFYGVILFREISKYEGQFVGFLTSTVSKASGSIVSLFRLPQITVELNGTGNRKFAIMSYADGYGDGSTAMTPSGGQNGRTDLRDVKVLDDGMVQATTYSFFGGTVLEPYKMTIPINIRCFIVGEGK